MKVQRYDKITLDRSKVIRLDNGMMRVPARLSRVGIQEYRKANGQIERAFRPADEVERSAAGFDAVTLVDDHPLENSSVVDASNAKRLSVGVVLNPVYRDGFVEAMVQITDATAIAKVEAGKVELSAGYFIDRDETPGVTADGAAYDFVHRNIRPNHVAIVDEGRAGHDVRLQLDSAADVAFTTDFVSPGTLTVSTPVPRSTATKEAIVKITVDGIEREVEDTTAQLILKERKMASDLLETARAEAAKIKTELSAKTAQCDSITEKLAKAEAEIKTAPEQARAALQVRAALDLKVRAIAPDLKLDAALDDVAVKRAVCAHAGIKLDGKDDVYVAVRFDVLAEDAEKKNPATEAAAAALKDPERKPEVDNADETPAKARAAAEAAFFAKK